MVRGPSQMYRKRDSITCVDMSKVDICSVDSSWEQWLIYGFLDVSKKNERQDIRRYVTYKLRVLVSLFSSIRALKDSREILTWPFISLFGSCVEIPLSTWLRTSQKTSLSRQLVDRLTIFFWWVLISRIQFEPKPTTDIRVHSYIDVLLHSTNWFFM